MPSKIIHRIVACFAMFILALILAGCGKAPALTVLEPSQVISLNTPATVTPGLTETPQPTAAPNTRTPSPTFDRTAYFLTNPPPTPTGTPVVDANGNVTWHPQKKMVFWQEAPGNTSNLIIHFILYWDGTLKSKYIEGSNSTETILKINQDEICKILNTVNTSGFFEGINQYHSSNGSGEVIHINGWKSYVNGAARLDSLISGVGYHTSTIPSEEDIIKPGLANTYYFLKNYRPVKPNVLPVESILVDFRLSDEESTTAWPLTSITLDEFIEMLQCRDNCSSVYEPTVFSGELAQEIIKKVGNGATFKSNLFNSPSIQITYEADAPDVPADTTLTCNTKGPVYPILPLNPANKFWYYALSGKWGVERVEDQNKIRVVNISGYENFYGYDAAFFGQKAIQVYPYTWSLDDQFLYINVLPADFTPNASLVNSIGLQQIDVKNEKIKYIFLGTHGETFDYQITYFGKQVVYIRAGDHPLKLVLANTSSGEEQAMRLTRPDGTPYTSAGTLYLPYKNDSIFFAATYTENGEEKTDILWTHESNLSKLQIIYTAQGQMKLDTLAFICPMDGVADYRDCKLRVNIDTGEIEK